MHHKYIISAMLLAASTVTSFAADFTTRAMLPTYSAPPLFTWTGVYVGAQVGYANVHDQMHIAGTNIYGHDSSDGLAGGVHLGYNYQVNQFVFGLEGDVDGLTNSSRNTVATLNYGTTLEIQGSVRGRVGIAWDRSLFYATGGVAFADIERPYSFTPSAIDALRPSVGRVGWTVGGGFQYAITNHWSGRVEYRYTDYGHSTDYEAIATGITHRDYEHLVRLGFSYKFDMYAPPPPVVAKY